MPVNLPMDLLRSFVAIVDTGSMVKASERVFLTQSALSLQMKRLADIVQRPILRRHAGTLIVTPAGEALLASAREILALNDRVVSSLREGGLTGPARIGMVQDFAETILSDVLLRFAQVNPDVQMRIRIANSAELVELIGGGELDIALYLGSIEDEQGVVSAPMVWFGAPPLLEQPVLPLALMTKPCLFRDAALHALESAGRPYCVALETPSVSVLRASVQAGFAVTCRTCTLLPDEAPLPWVTMPSLPRISYVLSTRSESPEAIAWLSELLREAVTGLQPT